MHMEDVLAILEKLSKRKCRSPVILAAEVYKATMPYLESGIHNVEEELDYCGEIEVILDEGRIRSAEARSDALNKIYDAAGFQHFWNG